MSGRSRRSSSQCRSVLLPVGRSRRPSVLQVIPQIKEITVNVGILGTGNLATTLGRAWAAAGHTVVVTGRSSENAGRAAGQIGGAAEAVGPADLAARVDAVVVAVAWEGLEEAISLVGGADGSLSGMTVIDCTNAVDYATGQLKPTSGSAAELVARVARGAHVVKALHLFAGASWPYTGPQDSAPVVAICGDQPDALERAAALTADLGGRTAVIGGLTSARQLEEAAGFVMRVVAAGSNPRFAVPDVDPASLDAGSATTN
ncbi:NAD(P)-binding domain-containing protein [Micromonospora sp. NPDC002296]|uniref:NADPH-dependent F420 reductase n=1 Tax=Micromonospora sp. NPDC002296 TaxID=3154271 RepID=UPI00333369F6